MFYPFFALVAQSPTRQATFRRLVCLHLLILGGACWSLGREPVGRPAIWLGHLALVAGIVEGALLIGWRLTQLPRSQALEFLLVSPLRPARLLLAEALVGLAQLGLITLAGLPVLMLLVADGRLDPLDSLPLLLMPFTWGALTGLGLTVWAYEPRGVRRWGERIVLGLVIVYLIVGVLAAENLRHWLTLLPTGVSLTILHAFAALHTHNPFGTLSYWLDNQAAIAAERVLGLQAAASIVLILLMARAAGRLQAHFRERHYQPVRDVSKEYRPRIGNRPLTWWAIKRVTEYSGRINLWLAGGFGALYAAYIVAGAHWPSWLGQRVFVLCDEVGGIAALTTGLVVLAAVPAAFQYGLWDSNAQDRCRRLELLLLTRLEARDYWEAASAAAWRRGRGYLGVAVLLWTAAVIAGRIPLAQVTVALASAVLLWSLYFTLGFRAFSRGVQASGLGLLLTIGLPLAAHVLTRLGGSILGALMPPGLVYSAHAPAASLSWLAGPLLLAELTLALSRGSLSACDSRLRRWYEQHHGRKVMS
ncbi:MAG TPA: hypothetical protein VMG10_36925 [Gemmataceae bacterium]|nr:hypothetical protein [Gemmataceae bacterium]